jgi:hypothetical protein
LKLDLIQTTTRDGLRLDGCYQAPTSPGNENRSVDGWVLVHGTGGNFYSSTLFDVLAERFLALGMGVVRVNTRGHDLMSMAAVSGGGIRAGAAYDIVDDCRLDLAAWTEWARRNVGPRIGWLGHSLGAIKCLYAQAAQPDPDVVRLVAVSPPRLSYTWFTAGGERDEFLHTYHQARALVEAGEPATLIEVRLPLPFVITAAGYTEKYGPDERYNYLRFISGIPCPTLVTLGGIEVQNNMAFRQAPQALAEAAAGHSQITCRVIDGADHFYSGMRGTLADVIEGWLRGPA